VENQQPANSYCGAPGATVTSTITAIDWSGTEHDFISKSAAYCNDTQLPVNGCFLSPDGTLMACNDSTSQAVDLLSANGATRGLGRKYVVLGWIDADHFLVQVDAGTIGVVSTPGGALSTLRLDHADQVSLAGPLPGAL